eukprot:630750-Pelagomonas_calceolata.AAC.2
MVPIHSLVLFAAPKPHRPLRTPKWEGQPDSQRLPVQGGTRGFTRGGLQPETLADRMLETQALPA